MPRTIPERVEVRRLLDWFNGKFFDEVTAYLVTEKINKRFLAVAAGGGPPDMHAIRAARDNIRYHLRYIGFLCGRRNCLAGDTLSYADLAAAAQLSWWTIWAMFRGTRTRPQGHGTRASNRDRLSGRAVGPADRDAAGGVLRDLDF